MKTKLTQAAKNAQRLLKLFGPTGAHWTRGSMALDMKGELVSVRSKKAYKWCLVGACDRFNMQYDFLRDALMARNLPPGAVAFNDKKGQRFPTIRKFLQSIVKEGK